MLLSKNALCPWAIIGLVWKCSIIVIFFTCTYIHSSPMERTSHSRRGAVHARNVKHLMDKYESNISKSKDALSDDEQRKDFRQRGRAVSPGAMDGNSELLRNGMRGEKGRGKEGRGYGGREGGEWREGGREGGREGSGGRAEGGEGRGGRGWEGRERSIYL